MASNPRESKLPWRRFLPRNLLRCLSDFHAADGTGDNAGTNDDNDGSSDDEEFALGTDALKADSDGDGVSDDDEVAQNRNPLVNEGAVIQIINSILLSDD